MTESGFLKKNQKATFFVQESKVFMKSKGYSIGVWRKQETEK